MNNKLEFQEQVLRQLYTHIFDQLSKLQIEEKFLERLAQNLIENIILKYGESTELLEQIQSIIEESDQDLIMQDMHIENLKSEGIMPEFTKKVQIILQQDYENPESFAYVKQE